MIAKKLAKLKTSVITVGDGRGFVIEHDNNKPARSAWIKSPRLDHIPIIEGFREDSTEA
jgi:hypothetical protein